LSDQLPGRSRPLRRPNRYDVRRSRQQLAAHSRRQDPRTGACDAASQRGHSGCATMAEAGLPGFEASLWFAVVAPLALPVPILTRLNREINAILGDAEVKKGLTNQAIQVETAEPDRLRQIIRDDIEKWRAIAQKVG